MSTMPSLSLPIMAQILKRQELVNKNKQAAREQLLRIQLMLAKKAK
jgi:hypothetical protein